MDQNPRLVMDGFGYAEGLRWRDDALWFSDMARGGVYRVDDAGPTLVAEGLGGPSGIGWGPGGTTLVALLHESRVVAIDPSGAVETFFDVAAEGGHHANELLTVGDQSYVTFAGQPYQSGDEFREYPDGGADGIFVIDHGARTGRVAAGGMALPNGMDVVPGGRELVVAETYRRRLLTFDRHDDGTLGPPRVRAELPSGPDGISLDAQGAVWAATPDDQVFLRVDADGAITDRIPVPGWRTITCVLGGPEGRTLYLGVAKFASTEALLAGDATGEILAVEVDVPPTMTAPAAVGARLQATARVRRGAVPARCDDGA